MNYPRQTQPPPQRRRRPRRGRQPTPNQPQRSAPPPGYTAGPEYGAPAPYVPGQPNYAPARRPRRRGRRGFTLGPGCIFGCVGIVGVLVLWQWVN